MPLTRPVSRRTFLKSTAAALAAPYFVPSTAFGRTAPSERITLGMIGLGHLCPSHLSALLPHREVQIVAVCDVDRTKREQTQKSALDHYGHTAGVDACNEYEKIIERADIDAVLIAVPDHWHAIIAIAASAAGKDVYCEKPLSLTVVEADAMVAAARRHGTVFQTGSQQRSESNFRRACELVRSGYIGQVREVFVGIGDPSGHVVLPEEPVPDGLDWDRWLGPAPWAPYSAERRSGTWSGGGWRAIRDYSGGLMTDWGAHHFDIAQWGLGMDGSGPVEIVPPNVSDTGRLMFRYGNGVVMHHGGANGIRFIGPDGWVEVNRGYLKTEPESLMGVKLKPGDTHLYESPGHHQDWLNCVRARRRPITDVAIGASSVTVCHLANIAWWLGRAIRWDPVKHALIGDPDAARWLERPMRAPYRLHAAI